VTQSLQQAHLGLVCGAGSAQASVPMQCDQRRSLVGPGRNKMGLGEAGFEPKAAVCFTPF